MKTYKISLSNIRYRNPFYIQCAKCRRILSDSNRELLCDIANVEGWVYDYKEDLIYCDECKKNIEKANYNI
jgi:uncharacterized protein with PIN domain